MLIRGDCHPPPSPIVLSSSTVQQNKYAIYISSISLNLIEIQCIHKLYFGKVL